MKWSQVVGLFCPPLRPMNTCLAELDDFHQVPNLIADGSQMLEQLVVSL